MGIFHSKVAPVEFKVPEQLNNQLDPRSPTVNINRSPIGTAEAYDKPTITRVRDLTADLTEILDSTQTPVRPETNGSKLQSLLDPRSPGSFDRTPLVLMPGGHDESNASNVGLCGTSLEYEEISCGEETASFSDALAVTETASLFSDISLNTELKADIECIIQGLHDANDASGKDPRSPSINIQRTPIVFEENEEEPQGEEENDGKQTQTNAEDKSTPVVIHQDENEAAATTPLKEKTEALKAIVNSAPRTPLGCVTNVKKTPAAAAVGPNNMRKTALFGHMKQNAANVGSAEIVASKKPLQTRSKIPTLRMK